MFNAEMKPEYVNCDGCTADGRLIEYCKICEIRNCAIEKGVENCAYCNECVREAGKVV